MKTKFIYILLLIFLGSTGFCQSKISTDEYKMYNTVLKQIFVQRKFETENLPKQHTTLSFGKLTVTRIVGKDDYKEFVSDVFYRLFLQLNEKEYKVNAKKIKVQVNSKYKNIAINLSRCYIEKDYAMLYVGMLFAPLNGFGAVYILKYNKVTLTWEIVKEINKWVS